MTNETCAATTIWSSNFWIDTGTTTGSATSLLWSPYTVSASGTTITIHSTVASGSASGFADTVWTSWNRSHEERVAVRRITEAQRRRREHEVARWREQMAAEEAERKLARRKARQLLHDHLTKEQRLSLVRVGYFDIQVEGKTYRIRQGTHGNVRLVENGREVVAFCAQPDGVPDEDAMLAQKLMLECAERDFLRIANATRLS